LKGEQISDNRVSPNLKTLENPITN